MRELHYWHPTLLLGFLSISEPLPQRGAFWLVELKSGGVWESFEGGQLDFQGRLLSEHLGGTGQQDRLLLLCLHFWKWLRT